MKLSQIDTKNDKNRNVSKILCIFSKFSTDFVNWNVENGQQGKHVLSSMLRKKTNAVFQTKIVENGKRKRQIFEKIFFTIFV